MAKGLRYYYNNMKKWEQSIYEAMLRSFENLESGVRVPKISSKEISDIYMRMKLDNPLLFYVTGFSMRISPIAEHMEVVPQYMFKKDKVLMYKKSIDARLTKLLRPMMSLSQEERELQIHEFICQNVTYDKLKKSYSHEVIGPLTQGVGVCEGIAKTVKLMCDELGIECIIALSENDPEKGIVYRHAWNVLKIGGKWCHMDATFDNSLKKYGAPRYDYLNVSDKVIFRDHCPLVYKVQECVDDTMFYYRKKSLSLTKYEDVSKGITKAIKKKQKYFTFHWRGGYLTKKVIEELIPIIAEAAEKMGKSVSLSFNFGTSVLHCGFEEMDKGFTVNAEEADESVREDNIE